MKICGIASLSLNKKVLIAEGRGLSVWPFPSPESSLTQSSSLPRRSPTDEDGSSLLSPNECFFFDIHYSLFQFVTGGRIGVTTGVVKIVYFQKGFLSPFLFLYKLGKISDFCIWILDLRNSACCELLCRTVHYN
jgi:hypothetical protein